MVLSKQKRRSRSPQEVVELMVNHQLMYIKKTMPGLSEQEMWLKAAARTRKLYLLTHKK